MPGQMRSRIAVTITPPVFADYCSVTGTWRDSDEGRRIPTERLTRIIHEDFYYTRQYVATKSLTAGGLAWCLGGFDTNSRE